MQSIRGQVLNHCPRRYEPDRPFQRIGLRRKFMQSVRHMSSLTRIGMKLQHLVTIAIAITVIANPATAASQECTKLADEKKLKGSPRAAYLQKCEKDATGGLLAACQKAAADKALAGAVRNNSVKRCLKDNTKKG